MLDLSNYMIYHIYIKLFDTYCKRMFRLWKLVIFGRIKEANIMLSKWEANLNIFPITGRGERMNLSNILKTIDVKDKIFELNADYPTIRYIDDNEYNREVYKYVEPNFTESTFNENAKFVLFSAPGATGKSALAKYVCYKENGVYWDLPDNKVAEYSFQGALSQAVGVHNLGLFIECLEQGKTFIVIDAFDEAEAGSGRTGVEFFLRDLNNMTSGCNSICTILLARTETAVFIKKFFIDNKIAFNHYEVGYFSEYNAKSYIKYGLQRLRVPITDIVNQCINEQFKEIKRILMYTNTDTFLGYAPVLNALAASYDNDRNTLNLLKNTTNSESNCALLKTILDDLLVRERDKFIKALRVKLPQLKNFSDAVYDWNEQLRRICGMILFDDPILFAKIDDSIPLELHEEYLEVINTQLPQHPFIQAKEKNGSSYYDFTGTAFRDFIIAYSLALEDTRDFVEEYLSENKTYCPSQMLIEFYAIFSKNNIIGKHIPLMYNSYKAHTQLGDNVSVYINGEIGDCSIELGLERNNSNVLPMNFAITDLENGIHVNQLSNCYIDIAGKVFVGSVDTEARINNSFINCNEIIWCSEHIAIEAYSPGESSLVTEKLSYVTSTMPKFEIKTDDKKNFKMSCPGLNGYFKLLAYKCDNVLDMDNNDFTWFSNIVRRIFSCLRSHSKDTPARKMDFIDNRIISTSENKKKVLDFLLKEKILYTDEQDWLYKLDTNKLSEYSIKWYNVREGDLESLHFLYNKYIEIKQNI